MDLHNIILPFQDPLKRWDIRVEQGIVISMKPSIVSTTTPQPPSLLLPPLCHPHIHLDKPYLLTCNHSSSANHPDYSDLAPQSGSFQEALTNTAEAKKRYTKDDLYLRGSQLLANSYTQGVTSLRAFVEVDHVTGLEPLNIAMQLKQDFADFMDVQVCAFAQDPIFSTEYGEGNRSIISTALEEHGQWIDVIGTTPYVEVDDEDSRQNIQWAIKTALKYRKHLDFHIEYNLSGGNVMAIFNYLLDTLVASAWPTDHGAPTIVLGHATRLTQASHSDLTSFSERIKESNLPVHMVGLPTSDLFMMGRLDPDNSSGSHAPLSRTCGTLNIPKMIKDYGFNACLSVNNVGNAFTPYGTGDPLALACFGVGLYHAGTTEDAKLLYEAVSTRAVDAIMSPKGGGPFPFKIREGEAFPQAMLLRSSDCLQILSSVGTTLKVPARPRLSIKDIVWDPPEAKLRSIVK